MNVYNEAHNLAAAIKGSDEYKNYMELREKINANSQLAAIVNDFQSKQLDLQMRQLSGNLDESAMQEIQELYGIMMKDPITAEYMQAEMRFSLMMNDVYKILGDAIGAQFGLGNQE